MLSSGRHQKRHDINRRTLFSAGLIMPLDLDQDDCCDFYCSPDYHDDDKTVSTASSPITPSSDVSALFPSWGLCLPEPAIDLSSWDATPDWVRNSSRLLKRSWDFNDNHLAGTKNNFHQKRRRYSYQVRDNMATSMANQTPEQIQGASRMPDMPLRFVEITPDNILSGDIHRAQGEWKRGRPRLDKSNSKTKSNKVSSPYRNNPPEIKAASARSTIEVPEVHTTASYRHALFQPVFDHLLVTDVERDFFASLFASVPLH
jgi:hypothetical protein